MPSDPTVAGYATAQHIVKCATNSLQINLHLPTPRVPAGAVGHVVRLRLIVQLEANLSQVTGVA